MKKSTVSQRTTVKRPNFYIVLESWEQRDRIVEAAAEAGMSVSEFVRRGAELMVARQRFDKPEERRD